jgi:hypothetical protein
MHAKFAKMGDKVRDILAEKSGVSENANEFSTFMMGKEAAARK